MDNKNSMLKSTISTIVSLVGTVLLAVFLKIIDNIMGDGVPLLEYVIACFIIIVISSIWYVGLAILIVRCLNMLSPRYTSDQYKVTEKCKYENKVCCADLAIDAIKGEYEFTLNKDIALKYNLVSEEDLLQIERSARDCEIWIFSYDLTTEVLGDKASNIVKGNISKHVKYREFYIYEDLTEGNASDNRQKMEEWYGDGVSFYPYSNPNGMLKYILSLFGIIMFVKSKKVEGYFSLRASNTKVKKPVYVKMPYCMTQRYYRILRKIKEQATE